MPTMKQIFRTKKATGANTFKQVCELLDLDMATRPSRLPENEESWTDEMITLEAASAAKAFKGTVEAAGWTVQEFDYVWHRMPEMK